MKDGQAVANGFDIFSVLRDIAFIGNTFVPRRGFSITRLWYLLFAPYCCVQPMIREDRSSFIIVKPFFAN